MPRPRLAPIAQHVLVHELKRAIDAAQLATTPAAEAEATRKLIHLLEENEVSALSSHVVHNLGCGRRTWLRQLSTTLPPSAVTDILWRMKCGQR